MLMNYAHTYPDAKIRYHASDMCLHIDSDAAYLVLPKARSRGAGHFYLSDRTSPSNNKPTPNGPILTECFTLRNVMASAAEAETNTIFENGRKAVPIRTTLEEMKHRQPLTKIKTDNSTADGILNSTMRKKKSKAYDMKIWWMRDRIQLKQFIVYWAKGIENLADYFTKHHPPCHHKLMRYKYLQNPSLNV